jgi:hypothetical protein
MRSLILSGFLSISFCVHSQSLPRISEAEVVRTEKILAADDMQGRKVFTAGIEKAAGFIEGEFREAGLKPLSGQKGYRQSFTLDDPESREVSVYLEGIPVDSRNVIAFTSDSSATITASDHYELVHVKTGTNLTDVYFKYLDADQNVLVFVDTSFARKFYELSMMRRPLFNGNVNRIFILAGKAPRQYRIEIRQKIKTKILTNLVGEIPGISKPEEYVIFSAHYDHLGTEKPDAKGDSVYNGANDNASGVTAVITLAKYFNQIHDNQRTLIFVTFTAEETGAFGSVYFAKKIDPRKVVALFNIEMIGTLSKWGKNTAYITGYEKSDFGSILRKNLKSSPFKFYPDPYPGLLLFFRSDNISLARMGVPAHTISTSKMDDEKYYHTRGDKIETLNLENMTQIIRAIGLSAGSVISGKDTPRRVQPE